MRRVASCLALVAGLLFVLAASPARAQPAAIRGAIKKRAADLHKRGKWIVLTVGFRDVVNAHIRNKLVSGLPTTIATRAYVFPDRASVPLSLSAQTCRIVFDLWDEVYRIELYQGGKRRKAVAVNVEGVLRRCAELRRLPVVAIAELKSSERYFVAVLVEVNPLSKKMLDKIKRWVARPRGAGSVGAGDSLFGSFVGLFITKVPAADRNLGFRTPGFVPATLPKLPTKKRTDKVNKRASR